MGMLLPIRFINLSDMVADFLPGFKWQPAEFGFAAVPVGECAA
jgi:hypothetical protein